MRENITTIPINDLFKPKDGCPICRMTEMLEKNYVEFIVGTVIFQRCSPSVRSSRTR